MQSAKNSTQKYSANIRLWHWLNTIIIVGSLSTVLINSTLFDKKSNTAFVANELKNAGATVTNEQARAVSHGLEDKIWDLHVYLGYFLVALFVYRLILEIFQRKDHRFFTKLKNSFKLKSTNSASKKDLFIKLIYLMFYLLLFIMILTGLSIKFDEEIGISKSFSHSLKEIHGFIMYMILSFIVIHIIGVFFAERKDQKGIVSDMINGG